MTDGEWAAEFAEAMRDVDYVAGRLALLKSNMIWMSEHRLDGIENKTTDNKEQETDR